MSAEHGPELTGEQTKIQTSNTLPEVPIYQRHAHFRGTNRPANPESVAVFKTEGPLDQGGLSHLEQSPKP